MTAYTFLEQFICTIANVCQVLTLNHMYISQSSFGWFVQLHTHLWILLIVCSISFLYLQDCQPCDIETSVFCTNHTYVELRRWHWWYLYIHQKCNRELIYISWCVFCSVIKVFRNKVWWLAKVWTGYFELDITAWYFTTR